MKRKITGKEGVEHFWLADIAKTNGAIYGTINNDADVVHSVKIGDRIKIPEADISDWLYERDGKMMATTPSASSSNKCPPRKSPNSNPCSPIRKPFRTVNT